MLIHKSSQDGGNIGPSIHLLHGLVFRGSKHGQVLIGISGKCNQDGLEIAIWLWWWRIYFYLRSLAIWRDLKKRGDHRLFEWEIIDLQEAYSKYIKLYEETDGWGYDFLARKICRDLGIKEIRGK